MVRKPEEYQHLLSPVQRPRRAAGVTQSWLVGLRAGAVNPSLRAGGEDTPKPSDDAEGRGRSLPAPPLVLFKPSVGWTMPSHTAEGSLESTCWNAPLMQKHPPRTCPGIGCYPGSLGLVRRGTRGPSDSSRSLLYSDLRPPSASLPCALRPGAPLGAHAFSGCCIDSVHSNSHPTRGA